MCGAISVSFRKDAKVVFSYPYINEVIVYCNLLYLAYLLNYGIFGIFGIFNRQF